MTLPARLHLAVLRPRPQTSHTFLDTSRTILLLRLFPLLPGDLHLLLSRRRPVVALHSPLPHDHLHLLFPLPTPFLALRRLLNLLLPRLLRPFRLLRLPGFLRFPFLFLTLPLLLRFLCLLLLRLSPQPLLLLFTRLPLLLLLGFLRRLEFLFQCEDFCVLGAAVAVVVVRVGHSRVEQRRFFELS